jgi:hypothetical protein
MPRFVTGNLWEDPAPILCFTSNSILNTHGELVMGRGSAAEAKQHCPTLPSQYGRLLQERGLVGGVYGVLWRKTSRQTPHGWGACYLLALQTKRHWRDPSSQPLIAYSLGCLVTLLATVPVLQHGDVALPFPGIGAGGLDPAQVRPLLAWLPERCTVYQYPAVTGDTI